MADPKSDFGTIIPAKIEKDPEAAKNVGAIFLIKITGDGGGEWTVNLKDDVGVKEGEHGEPDCTVELSAENWTKISGDPQAAVPLFFQQEIKVPQGNPMLATKLTQFLV